jgi:hypothetical protein
MYNWFECKVNYEKVLETGMRRNVSEPYLVDALSFTEAEARIIEEIKPFISGEFSVSNIRKRKFVETFLNETGDRYYGAKLSFITFDEKGGGEKRTTVHMLVRASTIDESLEIVKSEMNKSMVDYSIGGISETPIMDVFPRKK